MRFTGHKSVFYLILSTATILFLSVFTGCDKEPLVHTKPFARLLENETIESKILNQEINYAVLLPENYDSSTETFPVVYLLHGFGDDQSAWYKYGLIKYYSDQYVSENVPMIFIMPQGFNSYYVNRYNGSLSYMDFFTTEFVPQIDSIYRTKKDKTQRAVMGYSMGGYGALILPARNPELFTVSVPLSMSFRTDDQYLAESDGAFNYQWGPIFGGSGTQGSSRLTPYFKEYSPFYFFKEGDLSRFQELKFYIDCGDDEESLLVTNSSLHGYMRDAGIPHEFRVGNGGHSWDYWHNSLQEALHFISLAFQGADYPGNPGVIDVGPPVPSENLQFFAVSGTGMNAGILLPPGYDSINGSYPAIYIVHDYKPGFQYEEQAELFSLIYNSMETSKLSKCLAIDIPFETSSITETKILEIISQVDLRYKSRKDIPGRMIIGNREGGALVASIAMADTGIFGSCCLYNALLPEDIESGRERIFYYLDSCDKGQSYWAYHKLYTDLRIKKMEYEYRVRNGDDTFPSFLTGLSESFPAIRKRLSVTG